ncbi:MAG: cobalamin biosynthesis protein CobQ [Thermotogaceae bacterium]|nr:cobalamin biosynthesis protein CobQ [Thermotogaceae bacterium]
MEKKNMAFVGMFGSGKTEIAMNMALKLAKEGENVALADLDYVSPYFRSRDKRGFLEEFGIKVVVPPGKYVWADTPMIPPEVFGILSNKDIKAVLDVGGEEDGIAVLGYLRTFMKNTTIYFVINTRRPFTNTVEGIVTFYEKLRNRARVDFDFLVSNTNLGPDTTEEVIKEGEEIVKKASKILEIPVAFTVVPSFLKDCDCEFDKFIIERYMELQW